MKKILLITLCSDLFAVLVAGITLIFTKKESGIFFYFVIMVFGNTIFPAFLGVLIYFFIKRKMQVDNPNRTYILRILTLLFIFPFFLLLWSIVDVIKYNLGFSGLTLEAIAAKYQSEFSGFTFIAALLALFIPSFDILLQRKRDNIVEQN